MKGTLELVTTPRSVTVKKLQTTGIMAALSSALFLGVAPVLGKMAINSGFSAYAVVAFRTSIAALLMAIIFALFYRQYFYIFPVGLLGCGLAGVINGFGSLLYFSALNRLDASVAQMLYALYPFFVALWLALDNEPLGRLTLLRISLAVIATLLLTSIPEASVDHVGIFMMLGASLLYALHLPINQRVLFEVPAPTVTLYTLLFMSAVVLPAYLFFDQTWPTANVSWGAVIGLALTTFSSRIALFLGVKKIGGMQTALLGLAELFITIFLGHLLLGESLTIYQWTGAALLGVSLGLVNFERPTPPKRGATGWLSWIRSPSIPKGLWGPYE